MVSCSLSFSYILIPHRELVAAPGAHLCHWGTKGDSRAPSGTVSPQNNATIPLHFAAALLCWHRSCGAEFQTGSRAQALSAFSFLNQPGVSDFVPHLSLGQKLAQRWPQAPQGTRHHPLRDTFSPIPLLTFSISWGLLCLIPSPLWTLGTEWDPLCPAPWGNNTSWLSHKGGRGYKKRKCSYRENIYGKHLKTIIPMKPLSFMVVEEIRCWPEAAGGHLASTWGDCARLADPQKAEPRDRQLSVMPEIRTWLFQLHV